MSLHAPVATSAAKPLRLTAADVARLAGVQRPVVSMWRSRPVKGVPFPTPVDRRQGVELYEAGEIVDYLRATERGLNPEAADDVAAYAALASLTSLAETTAVAGLSALLCLIACGISVADMSAQDLLGLADELDPGDAMLVRELRALGDELLPMAAHAEALADAAYTVHGAFERLLRRYRNTCLPGHVVTARKTELDELVGRLVAALLDRAAVQSGVAGGNPVAVDDSDGDGGLLLAVQQASGDADVDLIWSGGDSAVERWTRRRLTSHGHASAAATADAARIHVRHLPTAGQPDWDDVRVVEELAALAVGLGPADLAVAIAPASALVDPCGATDLGAARDAVLRSGVLLASARLPAGLLTSSGRQALALWVLAPAPNHDRQDRWLAACELSMSDLDQAGLDDLVSDVLAVVDARQLPARTLAAQPDATQVPSRRLRYLRRRPVIDVITSPMALRVLVAPLPSSSTAGEVAAKLAACGTSHSEHLRVEGVEGPTARQAKSLGQLLSDRHVRVIKGRRLDGVPVHLEASGGVAVLGSPEVLGDSPAGKRRVDLMAFTTRYPAVSLTQPGDVIFVASPRPTAFLDVDGGAVVQAPARVLRVAREGEETLLPHLLMDAVDEANRSGAVGQLDYRRWIVRLVPAAQREPLRRALTGLDADRKELHDRLTRLDEAAAALIAGVTGRSVLVVSTGPPP